MGRCFYFPCGDGKYSDPAAGLAIVAHREPLLGEVITVLDRDQLNSCQQAILDRWPDDPPPLSELEAPSR